MRADAQLWHAREEFKHLLKDSLTVKNNLADLLSEVPGKQEEAKTLFVSILAKQRMLLGPEDTLTLITAHNLALMYNNSGEHDLAEPLLVASVYDM